MPRSEEELHAAILRCVNEQGFARALWMVLEVAKLKELETESTEFHTSYRVCANQIEAAVITISDL